MSSFINELSQSWCIETNAYEIMVSKFESIAPTNDAKYMEYSYDSIIAGDTAIIPVSGAIFQNACRSMYWAEGCSTQSIMNDISTALSTKDVKAIVLYFDTPGGQVSGTSQLSSYIFKNRAKKPIIAYVSGMAASAGYWIASSCSAIVADSTAQVGSIGTVYTYLKGGDKQIGKIVSSQSPRKQLDPSTPEGEKEIQSTIDKLADVFISSVAKYRNVNSETVLNNFGKGGLLVGQDAVKAGMADATATFEELLSEIQGENMFTNQNMESKIDALQAKIDALTNTNNFGANGNAVYQNTPTPQQHFQPQYPQHPQYPQQIAAGPVAPNPQYQTPAPQPQQPNIEAIQQNAFEIGKKKALETTKQILACCNMAGIQDLQTITQAVETQDLGKAQEQITNLRAQESRHQSINGHYSNSNEYQQRNEMVDMIKSQNQQNANPQATYNRGGEQW